MDENKEEMYNFQSERLINEMGNIEEFAAEKEKLIQDQIDEELQTITHLQGWGSWAGKGIMRRKPD